MLPIRLETQAGQEAEADAVEEGGEEEGGGEPAIADEGEEAPRVTSVIEQCLAWGGEQRLRARLTLCVAGAASCLHLESRILQYQCNILFFISSWRARQGLGALIFGLAELSGTPHHAANHHKHGKPEGPSVSQPCRDRLPFYSSSFLLLFCRRGR